MVSIRHEVPEELRRFTDARRGNWQRQNNAMKLVHNAANVVVCHKPACFTTRHLRLHPSVLQEQTHFADVLVL
jgi:hypothetical protein